ncbi:uncharacterized protein LOC128248707 [Octopus bimaculoides]|uniref:uncharacterized protein LOC128248707 n=1 Tax=Octopus bimaculoides TaxID=37653 RepID=UPI0022E8F788|nr:uncharacterized protein LOC128248707 [Octopus bimaculoides]
MTISFSSDKIITQQRHRWMEGGTNDSLKSSQTDEREGRSYRQTGDLIKISPTEQTYLKLPKVVLISQIIDWVYHPVAMEGFELTTQRVGRNTESIRLYLKDKEYFPVQYEIGMYKDDESCDM